MNYNNMSEWHHTVVVPRTPNVIFATHMQHLENVQRSGFLNDLPNKLYKDTLLTALAAAKEKPDWKFFITHTGGNYSTSCAVVHGEELLGTLGIEHYYDSKKGYSASYRLTLTTPSIRKNAQRKNYAATNNPKRMLKMVLEECIPTPPERVATQRAELAANKANQLINDATTYSVDSNINPTHLYAFLQGQGLWEAFKHVAVAYGANPEFGSEVERRCALKTVGDTLALAKKSGKLTVATPVAGGYYLSSMDTSRGLAAGPPVYIPDIALSDGMRTKLGMLKLASANTLVPDTGVRVNDNGNAYVVVGEG